MINISVKEINISGEAEDFAKLIHSNIQMLGSATGRMQHTESHFKTVETEPAEKPVKADIQNVSITGECKIEPVVQAEPDPEEESPSEIEADSGVKEISNEINKEEPKKIRRTVNTVPVMYDRTKENDWGFTKEEIDQLRLNVIAHNNSFPGDNDPMTPEEYMQTEEYLKHMDKKFVEKIPSKHKLGRVIWEWLLDADIRKTRFSEFLKLSAFNNREDTEKDIKSLTGYREWAEGEFSKMEVPEGVPLLTSTEEKTEDDPFKNLPAGNTEDIFNAPTLDLANGSKIELVPTGDVTKTMQVTSETVGEPIVDEDPFGLVAKDTGAAKKQTYKTKEANKKPELHDPENDEVVAQVGATMIPPPNVAVESKVEDPMDETPDNAWNLTDLKL